MVAWVTMIPAGFHYFQSLCNNFRGNAGICKYLSREKSLELLDTILICHNFSESM
jgi:hypothetical protein